MKTRTLVFLFAAATIMACNHSSTRTPPGSNTGPKNHLDGYPNSGPLVEAYTQFLRTLDTTDLSTSKTGFQQFRQLFQGQVPQVCDTGFMLFWRYQRSLNINDTLPEKFISPVSLDTLAGAEYNGNVLTAEERKAQQKLWDNFFIVQEEEATPFITPGWRLMKKSFFAFVSSPMKEVLVEQAKEEKEGFQEDAGLTIEPAQLATRTVWWEQFMIRYPDHIYTGWAKSNYNLLLHTLVAGMDNSPVMDYDSPYIIRPYFDTAYQLIRDSFPHSQANAVIGPFLKAVSARDSTEMQRIWKSLPEM
jgi:hypothetical protein